MKFLKQMTLLLLCAVVLAGLLPVTAFATDAAYQFTITADKTEASPGDEVKFTVTVEGSEPCDQFGLIFDFDRNVFEFVKGAAQASYLDENEEEVVGVKNFNKTSGKEGIAVSFLEAVTYSGKVGYMTLKVKENASFSTTSLTAFSVANRGDDSLSTSTNVVEIYSHTHTLVDHPAQAPTCTEVGWDAYQTCELCGYSTYVELPPAHSYADYPDQAPTCTEVGWEARQTCTLCGHSTYTELPALGHWVRIEGEAVVNSLIVDNSGSIPFTLDEDGFYYSNNHSHSSSSEFSVTAQYDCTLELTCGVSSETSCDVLSIFHNNTQQLAISGAVSDRILSLSLTAGDVVTVRYSKDSSVNNGSDQGWVKLVCEDAILPAEEVRQACTSAVVCAVCDATVREAMEHTLVEQPAQAPTCTEIGWDAYQTCALCDYSTYIELPAGHDFVEDVCTVCGVRDYSRVISNLYYEISNEQIIITGYQDDLPAVTYLPNAIQGYPVTTIRYDAFLNCTGLTKIVIPDSVTSIGYEAFYNCSSLTSVTIGNNVTSIGGSAFKNCSSLAYITIPDSVTSIGSSAFYGCSSLISVSIGNSVTSIGESAFYGCSSLIDVHITDIAAWCNISFGGSNANPLCYAHNLYLNGALVTELTIPDSVTDIGNYAFYYYSRLTSVTIGNSVTSIGDRAFYGCTSLTSITIPDSVTSIGSSAFSSCSNLTSITIPDSVASIGYLAFHNCDSLTGIWVDTGNPAYSSDDNGVLFNKDKTTLIQAPGGIIGHYTIPNSVTVIDNYAFYNCSSLTSVIIPDSVTSIGGSAFYNCSGLTSVIIPDSVSSIDSSAFSGCSSLTSVTIGNSVTHIGFEVFCDCSSLTTVIIPDSVSSIDSSAFSGCSSLTSVTLPDSVTYIGHRVFYECFSLTSINIPVSVTEIYENAFDWCVGLKDVYYAGTKDQWNAIFIGSGNYYLKYANIHYLHTHDYTMIAPVRVEPTCTTAGYIEYTCIFGETYRETIPPLGHITGTDTFTIAPTCTEKGYTATTCLRCGEIEKTELPGTQPLGHHIVLIPLKDATCTEDGISKVGTKCYRCQMIFVQPTYAPALGHSYADGTCAICGRPDPDKLQTPGDISGDEQVSNDDVLMLLWHCLFPEENPITVTADFSRDGQVSNDDVLTLLWHCLFPEENPLDAPSDTGNCDTNGHTYVDGICSVCGAQQEAPDLSLSGTWTAQQVVGEYLYDLVLNFDGLFLGCGYGVDINSFDPAFREELLQDYANGLEYVKLIDGIYYYVGMGNGGDITYTVEGEYVFIDCGGYIHLTLERTAQNQMILVKSDMAENPVGIVLTRQTENP